LNLTTDGAPAIALAVEATEPNTMLEGPRLRTEPLLEKVMVTGMVIQSFVLTGCVLAVYLIGLRMEMGLVPLEGRPTDTSVYFPVFGVPGCGAGPSCNFTILCGVETTAPCVSLKPDYITTPDFENGYEVASTMVTFTIIFAELARAYSSRSMRESVFKIGVFSNSWMQYGVVSAVIATWLLYFIPGVKEVFAMRDLTGEQFGVVFAFCFIPFVVDELSKLIYRITGFGKRPLVIAKLGGITLQDDKNAYHAVGSDRADEKRD
jgi:Ca2+-transporting ATPase